MQTLKSFPSQPLTFIRDEQSLASEKCLSMRMSEANRMIKYDEVYSRA
jgi:hypothetical protein